MNNIYLKEFDYILPGIFFQFGIPNSFWAFSKFFSKLSTLPINYKIKLYINEFLNYL